MAKELETDLPTAAVSRIEVSGLFDRSSYLESCSESAACEGGPLNHFCQDGWRQGLWPNPYFDPGWYGKTYGSELLPDENPLLHYLRRGELENAWPSPHFDPEWYRDTYGVGEDESPLRHYLLHRSDGAHSPVPDFDAAAYLEANPGSLEDGLDPYLHWLRNPTRNVEPAPVSASPLAVALELAGGNLERGEVPESVPWETVKDILRLFLPFLPFDEAWYRRQYPDVDAAADCGLIPSAYAHFIDYGFFEGRIPAADWRQRGEQAPEP